MLGLAIYNAVLLDFPLPLALYRKLIGQSCTLRDLQDMEPTLGKSLTALLQYEGKSRFGSRTFQFHLSVKQLFLDSWFFSSCLSLCPPLEVDCMSLKWSPPLATSSLPSFSMKVKPDASIVVSTTGDRLHAPDMQLTLGVDMQPITAHNVAKKHRLLLCIIGFKPDKVMHLLCIR